MRSSLNGIEHGRREQNIARLAFLSLPGAELVIGTGVVGALSSGLKAGDLVLSDRALTIDADGRVAEHLTALADPQCGGGRSLAVAGLEYSTGAILTADSVLAVAGKRRAKEAPARSRSTWKPPR